MFFLGMPAGFAETFLAEYLSYFLEFGVLPSALLPFRHGTPITQDSTWVPPVTSHLDIEHYKLHSRKFLLNGF